MVDETLYLYTSLTAGSSQIITATSRMETILKANKVPFRAVDCATDEKARQLWGRRSKGKKLPGLVKYGQILGDFTEVEEWNEYGELVDQIESASDLFADTPMTDTPMPAPVNTIPPSKLKPIIETPAGMTRPPPARQGSETRHISISEPERSKKEDKNVAAGLQGGTPLAMAMRQVGAEAAAKATQNKSAASKPKSVPSPATTTTAGPARKSDPSESTPSAAATKSSTDAALDTLPTDEKVSLTSAKTPAQLANEGVSRTSIDKTAAAKPSAISGKFTSAEPTRSNEEQLLEQRRSSSIAHAQSSLKTETSVDDISSEEESSDEEDEEDVDEAELSPEKAAAQAVANVKKEQSTEAMKEKETAMKSDDNIASAGTAATSREHRDSGLSEATKEGIKAVEKKTAIKEKLDEDVDGEEEDDDDDDDDDEDDSDDDDDDDDYKQASKDATVASSTPAVTSTDKSEAKVAGGAKPQQQKAADAHEVGKSVGD